MESEAGATHACAACRHQRRKCNPDCVFAPYFPPHKTEQFQNVLKLFGVSNVLKILNCIEPTLWPEAMKTIQLEADVRRQDPVHGCLGIIHDLIAKIEAHKRQLFIVNQQLQYCRQKEQEIQQQQQQQQQLYNMLEPSPSSVFNQPSSSATPPPFIPTPPPFGGYYYPPPPNMGFVDPVEEIFNFGEMSNYHPTGQEYTDIKPFNQVAQSFVDCTGPEDSSAESGNRESNTATDNRMKNVASDVKGKCHRDN